MWKLSRKYAIDTWHHFFNTISPEEPFCYNMPYTHVKCAGKRLDLDQHHIHILSIQDSIHQKTFSPFMNKWPCENDSLLPVFTSFICWEKGTVKFCKLFKRAEYYGKFDFVTQHLCLPFSCCGLFHCLHTFSSDGYCQTIQFHHVVSNLSGVLET